MKSEVRVAKPPLRITITIGLFLSLLVVFLSWQYQWLFYIGGGVIILSIGGYSGIMISKRAIELIAWSADKWLDFREKRARVIKQEFEQHILTISRQHRILHSPRSDIRLIEAVAEKQPMLSTTTNEQLPLLLDKIRNESCIAFWGGRDSGKTTCALWWISTRQGQNIVCDPKPRGHNPWSNAIVTHKIDQIEQTVDNVYFEFLRRQNKELLNEPTITLFIDELYMLTHVHNLDIMTKVFGIITAGREYNINAGFTTSSKGVKALGNEGMSGLSEALVFVHTLIVAGNRQTTINFGEGEIKVQSPGPYYNTTGHIIDTDDFINLEVKPNQTEAAVLTLKAQDKSYNEIARQVYGHTGGKQTGQIKQIINKFS